MKYRNFLLISLVIVLTFSACRNKTVVLLNKKWDCVRVENIAAAGAGFKSAADSLQSIKLEDMLKSLSWTFKDRMQYECSLGNRVTATGKYTLPEKDKILLLTPASVATSNSYVIKALTENELVLSGRADNTNITLYFQANR